MHKIFKSIYYGRSTILTRLLIGPMWALFSRTPLLFKEPVTKWLYTTNFFIPGSFEDPRNTIAYICMSWVIIAAILVIIPLAIALSVLIVEWILTNRTDFSDDFFSDVMKAPWRAIYFVLDMVLHLLTSTWLIDMIKKKK